jgi:hypothetical protein
VTRFDDDILLLMCLIFAQPTQTSLKLGACLLLAGLGLIFWMRGYQIPRAQFALVGPYRFVRYPRRLALWLIGLALSFATLSFPAMVWALGMLPWFLDRDESTLTPEYASSGGAHYERYVPKLLPTLIPYMSSELNPPGLRFQTLKALFAPGFIRKTSMISIIFVFSSSIFAIILPAPSWFFYAVSILWVVMRVVLERPKLKTTSQSPRKI